MKKLLTIFLTGSMLLVGARAFALTLDEAKTDIDKQATEKKLGAKDHSQATATLQRLVDRGVPVEHAYRVVEASIDQGIKGKDLAEVAKSIESTGPGARTNAASVAADAIQHKYTARDTVQMTNTYGKTVAAGAPVDGATQVMSHGITNGIPAGQITAAANTYAGEIRSGTAPGKAAENATRTMDRDRHRMHDHDHMGSGPGMDHGIDHGGGMGPGAGPGMGGMGGMGGPRR